MKPATFKRWLRHGDRPAVYYRGNLGHAREVAGRRGLGSDELDTAGLAWAEAQAGRVRLMQRRDPAQPGEFLYMAVKRRRA